jgi:hypothetical protein
LSPKDIERLLQSDEVRDVLLGLHASVELGAWALLPLINDLRIHTNQHVSKAAARSAELLGQAVIDDGAEILAEERKRSPGRSVIFPRLGTAEDRCDVLRWMLHDYDQPTEGILEALRSALADDDWQVRVTGMLVAARLGASDVWLEIKRVEIPDTSRSGLNYEWRSLLRTLQKAVLAHLAGEPLPDGDDDKATLMRHLRHIVAGEDDGIHDEAYEWVANCLRPPEDD